MADDPEHQFCTVTGATRERARFYLDAAGGDVQRAVAAFYDEDRQEERSDDVPPQPAPPQPPVGSSGSSGPPPGKQKGGVATLSDYSSGERDTRDDDSQKFFAGGSEHSGQMITGPPRKKRDVAEEVFEAAKKQGAVPVEEEKKTTKGLSTSFHGTGFRLGDTEDPSEVVAGPSITRAPQKVSHKLTFWKNGFSIDNGPLRDGQSPEDHQFLQSVSKGEIPQELIHAARGGEVDIDIEDRRTELFVPPKVQVVSFSGAGHKLGNLTPELSSAASAQTFSATSSSSSSSSPVVVDTTQPTTSLQIRLADGSRLQAKFNHTHTVADIRRYIEFTHPEMTGREYLLMTTFPNRPLTDPHETLAGAKLLNSVIVQKM